VTRSITARRGRLACLVLLATSSAVLSGCSFLSFADGVDYSGPFENEVGACAEIAMKADLREDDAPVSTIWVRNVTVDDLSARAKPEVVVYGETHTSDSAPRVYAWSCDVVTDIAGKKLTAEILSFELVDR